MRVRGSLLSSEDQGATFVELFFDLVFVFAITELTGTLAEHLDWQGVGRAVVVFWLVWWAWTQFTWALNPADTTHPIVRVGTLAATGVAFVMAASVHDAFGAGAIWFAVTYVLVRLLGLGIYAGVGRADPDLFKAVVVFGSASIPGMIAVLIGAYAPVSARGWWWLGAIVLDLVAAGVGGSGPSSVHWQLRAGHFAERHGLFVIIALGESLIAAGTAVVGGERTAELAAVTVLAVATTCLLWWTYFGHLHPSLERRMDAVGAEARAPIGRDAFSVIHFPLIGGVVGIAIAFHEAIAHPSDPLHAEVTAALAVGLLLFLGAAAAACRRVGGATLLPRLAITVALAVLLVVLGEPTPVTAFSIVVGALILIVATERADRLAPG